MVYDTESFPYDVARHTEGIPADGGLALDADVRGT